MKKSIVYIILSLIVCIIFIKINSNNINSNIKNNNIIQTSNSITNSANEEK